METVRVQFRLNPEKQTHRRAIEKMQASGKEPKEYIIDAILAFGEADGNVLQNTAVTGISEEQLRRVLREELAALGADAEVPKQKEVSLPEPKPVSVPENPELPKIPEPDETEDTPFFPEEEEDADEDMEMGLNMLSAFNMM